MSRSDAIIHAFEKNLSRNLKWSLLTIKQNPISEQLNSGLVFNNMLVDPVIL